MWLRLALVSDLSFLSGPVGGALVAGITSVLVLSVTLWHQRKLESDKDARALRDARRERLRATFESILTTLEDWERDVTAFAIGSIPPIRPSNRAERQAEFDRFVTNAAVVHHLRVLELERETSVHQRLKEIMNERFWRYSQVLVERDLEDQIRAQNDLRLELMDALSKSMKASLLILEQPVNDLDRLIIFVPSALGAVPTVKHVKFPRWWLKQPKEKIIFEKPFESFKGLPPTHSEARSEVAR
jgi:hypothetical protein